MQTASIAGTNLDIPSWAYIPQQPSVPLRNHSSFSSSAGPLGMTRDYPPQAYQPSLFAEAGVPLQTPLPPANQNVTQYASAMSGPSTFSPEGSYFVGTGSVKGNEGDIWSMPSSSLTAGSAENINIPDIFNPQALVAPRTQMETLSQSIKPHTLLVAGLIAGAAYLVTRK